MVSLMNDQKLVFAEFIFRFIAVVCFNRIKKLWKFNFLLCWLRSRGLKGKMVVVKKSGVVNKRVMVMSHQLNRIPRIGFVYYRTQNYIFWLPYGLKTTYLPVENFILRISKHAFFALMDSELHIHGFKTTYFDRFTDSKLYIWVALGNGFRKSSVSFISLHNLTGKYWVRRKYKFRVY